MMCQTGIAARPNRIPDPIEMSQRMGYSQNVEPANFIVIDYKNAYIKKQRFRLIFL